MSSLRSKVQKSVLSVEHHRRPGGSILTTITELWKSEDSSVPDVIVTYEGIGRPRFSERQQPTLKTHHSKEFNDH